MPENVLENSGGLTKSQMDKIEEAIFITLKLPFIHLYFLLNRNV
jgi:hypothetical protein